MTLRERYTLKKKANIGTIGLFFLCFFVFFLLCFSIAKYEKDFSGNTNIDLANWEIAINDRKLTSSESELTNCIRLIPTTNIDESNPNKVKSGQTGYFDITINPAGTEVSFEYKITIDETKSIFPNKFVISSYSINNGESVSLASDKTMSANVLLNGKDGFTNDDAQLIRYSWDWAAGDDDDIDYSIVIKVELKQII